MREHTANYTTIERRTVRSLVCGIWLEAIKANFIGARSDGRGQCLVLPKQPNTLSVSIGVPYYTDSVWALVNRIRTATVGNESSKIINLELTF